MAETLQVRRTTGSAALQWAALSTGQRPDTEAGQHACGWFHLDDVVFECGALLPRVRVYFETWGRLNAAADNAVVVCHALTGDAHAADGGGRPGWWSGLIGPGRAIDTNRYFVIASNVIGGCAGSTGPSDLAEDGRPYAMRFPAVTVRDMVAVQMRLLDALGVRELALVIGGSLGGMQAWEWAVMASGRVRHTIAIAAHPAFPPLGIGYNEAMRMAIMADADWQNGEYYGTGRTPQAGLAAARAIGMLTYRTDLLFEERFGRRTAEAGDGAPASPRFAVESYLRHQGDKLNRRFDANSYLYLTRAMDSHDIGRGRGGMEAALRQVRGRLTVIGIDTDYLYAPRDLRRAARLAADCGVASSYRELSSKYGHDAFLIEFEPLSRMVEEALREPVR
ncbi:homoserine O-acetyltransferase MetX [Alicyclobacillus macrosporangiidus]|uniref:Homoserine O-acetyltransferase n=1 Tax=Alicyclobacillus macrosporangiidus TaxID=392015 RepID=A0A1I7FHM5_9BACL|nr:homoserine O-acetyltransferase [Alicyclobacillus macrosporangiidus]SFU35667.1 homoserine O-acetyltransferase [Alicyclobacillus macrosporangiidus]